MAENKPEKTIEKKQEPHVIKRPELEKTEVLVRIMSTDIPGSRNVYVGLTRIKGISFAISNAICHLTKINKSRKISSLSKEEIEKISETIKNLKIPTYMLNRRNDFDSGEGKHLITSELDLKKEFDIKRLKKIKSYKGVRHSRGLPVRGQRTKSHFRKQGKRKVVGVRKKK